MRENRADSARGKTYPTPVFPDKISPRFHAPPFPGLLAYARHRFPHCHSGNERRFVSGRIISLARDTKEGERESEADATHKGE